MTDHDQLTFQNPVDRFREISPPKQDQPEPGFDSELLPKADHGEQSYRGTGRLKAAKHSLPVQTLGSVQQWPLRLPVKAPTSH